MPKRAYEVFGAIAAALIGLGSAARMVRSRRRRRA